MNVPEGVNRETENLLSRIPIRDLTFCDVFFRFFMIFTKFDIFGKIVIFGKSDPGTPRGRHFGKGQGSKSGKMG